MTGIYFINFYIYYMLKQYFGYFMLNILFKLVVPIHVFYIVAARRFKIISEAPITFLLESTWVCV